MLYACHNSPNGSESGKEDRASRIESAIKSTCQAFDVKSCSFVIADSEKVLDSHFDSSIESVAEGKSILEGFTAPLCLWSLVHEDSKTEWFEAQDTVLCGDSLLQKLLPQISDKTLKVCDLIRIPAEQSTIDPRCSDSTVAWIRQLGVPLKQFEAKELDIDSTESSYFDRKSLSAVSGEKMQAGAMSCKTLLNNLATVSLYFDRENVTGYRPIGKDIPDPYPTWYVHNLVGFAGWQILRFEKHVVFWNYFRSGKTDILLLKGIDRPFFTALAFPMGKLPSPLLANQNDILLSPFATAILKVVFLNEEDKRKEYSDPDYMANMSVLKGQFAALKNKPYNFLYFKELLSRALFLKETDKSRSDALFNLYEQTVANALPREVYNVPLLASIHYVPDNFKGYVVFTLDTTTRICVQAVTQKQYGTDKGIRDGVDAVELHFGTQNSTRPMTHYYHTMFRGYDKIEGVFDLKSPACFDFRDMDDTSYVVTVKIPWANIGLNSPDVRAGMRIKFDAVLYDNDIVEYRKSVLSWSVLQKDNLQKPDSMGDLVLSTKPHKSTNRVFYCPYLDAADFGKLADVVRNSEVLRLPLCPISFPIAKGSWCNNDNSGGFKAFWDREAMYIIVDALDNIKNSPMFLFPDKAYLEKVDGGSIWKAMGDDRLTDPVYFTRQMLTLPAGTYRLRYQSDRNHSFERWVGGTPALDDYGVFVWKVD